MIFQQHIVGVGLFCTNSCGNYWNAMIWAINWFWCNFQNLFKFPAIQSIKERWWCGPQAFPPELVNISYLTNVNIFLVSPPFLTRNSYNAGNLIKRLILDPLDHIGFVFMLVTPLELYLYSTWYPSASKPRYFSRKWSSLVTHYGNQPPPGGVHHIMCQPLQIPLSQQRDIFVKL